MSHVHDTDIPLAVARRWSGQRTCTYAKGGDGCERKHFARGLCQAHYMRLRRHGDCGAVAVAATRPRHLKDHQVVMARRKVRRGEWRPKDAAEYFGCSYTTMMDALRGKTFKGLSDAGIP